MSWVEVDGAGWSWVEVDGAGWRWMELGGDGWSWVEVGARFSNTQIDFQNSLRKKKNCVVRHIDCWKLKSDIALKQRQ